MIRKSTDSGGYGSTHPIQSSPDPKQECVAPESDAGDVDVASYNALLGDLSAVERIRFALRELPTSQILTSSFGAQAAVSLHLLTLERADIPVVFLDTGYLFPETYQFIEHLCQSLDLNLRVYRSFRSPAWQEAIDGQRWSQGLEGIEAYNQENKVEPLQRALQELHVGTWFTGLRRVQASTRSMTPFVQTTDGVFKVNPIADWTDQDVHQYLLRHQLPYHPLAERGYVSIGDTHTTLPLHEADTMDDTRFFGLKRECGIHEERN
jgi:phosphoadenosine phosphosulfate reductase